MSLRLYFGSSIADFEFKGKPVTPRKPFKYFMIFFVLFLTGLAFLAMTGPDGSGAMGFFASLFCVGGTLGMFAVLLRRGDGGPADSSGE